MSEPPFNPQLARLQSRGNTGAAYKRAPKQEHENAKRLGGVAIPASGSRFRKGDTEVPNLVRIECKATEANSFRVTRGMMQTVNEAGMLEGQIPIIEIEFVDNVSNVLDTYCVMRRKDAESLITRIADAEQLGSPDRRDIGDTKLNKRKLPTGKRFR